MERATALLRQQRAFDVIRLRHVRSDAAAAAFLDLHFRDSRMAEQAPWLDLTQFADEAAYDARYTSTQRKRRKKIRKSLEDGFGPLAFELLAAGPASDRAIAEAVTEKCRWLGSRGRHNRVLCHDRLVAFLQLLSRCANTAQLVTSRLAAGGRPISWELGLRYRGGRVHWGLLCTAAFDDGHGSVAGYVASVTSLVGPDGDQRSLRDAMELCRDPMALMEPVGDAAEIKDFRVLRANSRALTMLRMREEDLLGASETEIYPFETRLGLVLDYAQVLATGDSSQRVVTMPAGPLAGTYQISAMPCYGNVMVVARGLGDGRQAWDSARVWDSLTGLNNREGLLKQLREFDQDGDQPVTLALLDIDDFTGVNDLLGRLRSDRFLIEVGRILSEIAGAQDLVARIGNDEFAILTTTIGSRAQADAFGDLIRTRMKRGVSVGGQHFTAAASVGVAWTGDGDRVGELLAVADAAMAESKAGGGDAVTLGHRERRTPAMRAVAMETELRDAIEEQQFVLHYQPVIDLASGRIRGAEALIRWQHPQRGTVPPAEFIGVAERRHLITRIGEWVVEEAFGQLARWRSTLGYVPALALNTSIGQLTRPGLARTILQCAEREGIDPHSIQLEITESQLLHADDSTLANLHACQEAGCELAIDDFGTGHAGFDYLRQIPARVLKVDKTFIDGLAHDTTDGAIVAGVIALGHGLGLSVIAEGVETEEQAQALRALNCDAGQGWLWHPALPAEDLEALLLAGDVTG